MPRGRDDPGRETLPPGLRMLRKTDYLLVPAAAVLFGINQPLSRVLIDERAAGEVPRRGTHDRRRARLPRPGCCCATATRSRAAAQLGMLLVFGIVGIAVLQWMLTEAIARLDVGLALTIGYTAPLLVGALVPRRPASSISRAWCGC